jgi:hypothetical protein
MLQFSLCVSYYMHCFETYKYIYLFLYELTYFIEYALVILLKTISFVSVLSGEVHSNYSTSS